MAKLGFQINIPDGLLKLTPMSMASILRDLSAIKIFVEENQVLLNKNEQQSLLKTLRNQDALLDNCWSYSLEIEKYLFAKKVFDDPSLKKASEPFDYIN